MLIKVFNTIATNLCPHCEEDCEYINYGKKIKVEKQIPHYTFNPTSVKLPCEPKYLCEYLLDSNNTIETLSWYEELRNTLNYKIGKPKVESKKNNARTGLTNLIIVHLRFATPKVEMNILDARYTFYDKLANLGGTIGMTVF